MDEAINRKYPINKKTAERIKSLRRQHRETQISLSIAMGYDESGQAVARWESCKVGVSRDTLLSLAKHWDVVPEYLAGETDTADPIKYYAECEAAADEGMHEYYENERAERARLESLFLKCGFHYSDVSDNPAYMFDPDVKGPHLLSDTQKYVPTAVLSPGELDDLFNSLHDVIALACLKKSRKGLDHGND